MKDNNNKELIEVIKQQLKNSEELPYKPGAWESFREKYEAAPKRKALIPLWVAAAASVAVLAFGALFVFQNGDAPNINTLTQVSNKTGGSINDQDSSKPYVNSESTTEEEAPLGNVIDPKLAKNQNFKGNSFPQEVESTNRSLRAAGTEHLTTRESLYTVLNESTNITLSLYPENKVNNPSVRNNLPIALFPDLNTDIGTDAVDNFVGGKQVDKSYAYTAEVGRDISPKKMRLAKNLKLGAFVSPSTTEQSFDMGGGMVLAYQLSDKIAVRTGASFNQYEVGILGSSARPEDGRQNSPTTAGGASLVSESVPYRTNNMMLPNLNSVSSKMQTLDVPLEIKYNVTKDYYVVGGASYAFVLSQERYNHYSEYTDAITYSSASDSDKPTSTPQKTVERKIKSSTENVDSNGFGGFVNFSIGKKTGLTKNLNISVEPFVKIPVGSFKQTDMNYTNGGIRIITNF